jgi:hypothetical protein
MTVVLLRHMFLYLFIIETLLEVCCRIKGTWSSEDANYVVQYTLGEERNMIEMRMIQDRLVDKYQLIVLFVKKFISMGIL